MFARCFIFLRDNLFSSKMTALNLDAYQCIALASDAATFRAMAATSRALRQRFNDNTVQQEAKRRFARKRIKNVDSDGSAPCYHRTFFTLPNGATHGNENVWCKEDRCVYRCQWADGARHGVEEWFALSGVLTHRVHWHEGDRLSEEFVPSQKPRTVNIDGHELTYVKVDGLPHGYVFIRGEGKLVERKTNVCRRLHGALETWNGKGVRTYVQYYEDNERHGREEHWNGAGIRTFLGYHEHDQRHGLSKHWNVEGKLVHLVYWVHDDGRGIGTEDWNDLRIRTDWIREVQRMGMRVDSAHVLDVGLDMDTFARIY